jgi:hypothetical protein
MFTILGRVNETYHLRRPALFDLTICYNSNYTYISRSLNGGTRLAWGLSASKLIFTPRFDSVRTGDSDRYNLLKRQAREQWRGQGGLPLR